MTDNTIEVLIKVTGAGGEEVVAAITDSLKGLGDQAQASLEPVNENLDTITSEARLAAFQALAAAGVEAFAAIAGAAMEFVDAAAESELVIARLNMGMDSIGKQINMTTDEVVALGDSLSAASGFDDEEIIAGMSKLLMFGNMNEEQFIRASNIAVAISAKTGKSITESFAAVGRSLDSPAQGFGRLGREISKLDPAQQAAINSALELGDTLKAQDLLLKGYEGLPALENSVKEFAATYSGQMMAVGTATANFKENIGMGLLPALKSIPMPVKVASSIIGDLGKTIFDAAIPIYALVMALKVLGGAGGIAGLFAGIFGGATSLAGAFSFLSAVIHGTFLSIIGTVGAALGAITLPIWALIAAIAALFVVIITLGPAASKTFMMIADIIAAVVNRIVDELFKADSIFNRWLINLGQRFRNWVISLTNTAGQLATIFQGIGKRIVEGIWAGIQGGWEWLKTNISNSMKTLLEWVKKQLGIKSPSLVFAVQVGQPMAEGIAQGFSSAMQGVAGSSILQSAITPLRTTQQAYAAAGNNYRYQVGHIEIHGSLSQQERRYFDQRAERISERSLTRLLE